MKKALLVLSLVGALALADKSVLKTATINQNSYPDKSVSELQEMVLKKAKSAAANEIYGEDMSSATVMANGRVLDDVVKKHSGGVIRLKGEPKYSNGKSFGELVVTIEAYATDEDIKNAASANVSEAQIDDADSKIEKVKRGFYGVWGGFAMRNDGSSKDVKIDISDAGEAIVAYPLQKCGGDLIIQEKGISLVKFKEKIVYGDSGCARDGVVWLQKVNDTQVTYTQFGKDGVELSKGTLYRE